MRYIIDHTSRDVSFYALTVEVQNKEKMMADKFKIEKDVPMPRINTKYPFSQLNIGDSVHFTFEDRGGPRRIRSAMQHNSRLTGYRFMSRKTPTGVRIWRIE